LDKKDNIKRRFSSIEKERLTYNYFLKEVEFSMKKIWLIGLCLVIAILFSFSTNLIWAAEFPTKTITIICPFSPGGGTDALARILAKVGEPIFKQSIVVINRTGGGGAVGMTEGYLQKPDGYTLTLTTVDMVLYSLMGTLPWTPDEFKPVMLVNSDSAAVTVQAKSPWDSLEDLINDAKKRPGEIKIHGGDFGIWGLGELALEEKTGTIFNKISYTGGAAPAVKDLLGGHIDAVTCSVAEVRAHVDAGTLRILAVMSSKRDAKYPDVPTLKELGYDVEVGTWRAIEVPKDTPDEIVDILHQGFKKVMEEEEFLQFMKNTGLGIDYRGPSDFGKMVAEQEKLFATLLDKHGVLKK